MSLRADNINCAKFLEEIKCELILNKNTMTEKLICNNQVIYEAPICTCLSYFLNDSMAEMETLTKKSIHRSIASILKKFGVAFGNDELINDDICAETITAKFLGMDSIDEVYTKLYKDEIAGFYDTFVTADLIVKALSIYEQMFSHDAYWDNEDEKTQHDVLKDVLSEYIANFNTEPLCKELSFFHHIFNNEAYYTIHNSSLLGIYYQKNSEMPSEFLFKHLRQTYISLHQGQSRYIVKNYQDICVMTLYFALQNNLTINKCKNCEKYFIPLSRSDEVYCDNPSPKDPAKTCKQYGKTTGNRQKRMNDPALKMWQNTNNAKQMLVRRNPDIKAYADNFDRFKRESAEWKRKYKSGKCTADEFIKWLNEQKGKRT